jgi:hypothetical protein
MITLRPYQNDLLGNRYGRLVVVESLGLVDGRTSYRCECDCGGQAIKSGSDLHASVRRGHVIGCGCTAKEAMTIPAFGKREHATS